MSDTKTIVKECAMSLGATEQVADRMAKDFELLIQERKNKMPPVMQIENYFGSGVAIMASSMPMMLDQTAIESAVDAFLVRHQDGQVLPKSEEHSTEPPA